MGTVRAVGGSWLAASTRLHNFKNRQAWGRLPALTDFHSHATEPHDQHIAVLHSVLRLVAKHVQLTASKGV